MRGLPVQLIDGRIVDSWSEDYRHEMEARSLIRMAGLERGGCLTAILRRDPDRYRALLKTMEQLRMK
jgi:hypothetical protein